MRYAIDLTRFVQFFALLCYGLFLSIDLVVYHRSYFSEKLERENEARRRRLLEDGLDLGDRVQKLLMPDNLDARFDSWKVNVFYKSAERMAGDWFTYLRQGGKAWLFCGDVVGKGPQAAVVTSSLLTTMHNAFEEVAEIQDVVLRVDQSLSRIFKSKMHSTIGAVELSEQGEARLMSHGFPGWMLFPKNAKGQLLAASGSLLGTGNISNPTFQSRKLEPGDRLVIFSDGIAEGSRMTKKILLSPDLNDHEATTQDFIKRLIAIGSPSAQPDDKVLIVLTYDPANRE